MHPAIEKRLKVLHADLMRAENAEIEHRLVLRARVEVGNNLRRMLQEHGIDPATIIMTRVIDEAAAELAQKPDSDAWRAAEATWEAAQPNRDQEIDGFYSEIIRIGLIHFADGHRPALNGSLMEWFAWCIVTPTSKHEPSPFSDYFVQAYQRRYHNDVANEIANNRRPIR